jgi:hypothetical protein
MHCGLRCNEGAGATITAARRRRYRAPEIPSSCSPSTHGRRTAVVTRFARGLRVPIGAEMAQRDLCLLEQAERSMAGELGSDSICV